MIAKPTKSKAKTLVRFYHTWLDEVLDDAIRSLEDRDGAKILSSGTSTLYAEERKEEEKGLV